MASWIVTIKIPRRDDHDPVNKVTGSCPIPPHLTCTDVTGQHHSVLTSGASADEAAAPFVRMGWHITRVEQTA